MERRRFALFDSLRALAALGVIGIHVGAISEANLHASYGAFTSHLNVGVTLFFLISGFLLYRPHAVALLRGSPPPALGRYALRRFLRIAPAYWVALTLLAVWPGLLGLFGPDWWLYYGFAQSYVRNGMFLGIAPAWSLSVEVAFYALLPLLAAGIARASRGRPAAARARAALALLAGLAALGLAFRAAVHRARAHELELMLPNWILWFALGMSLAVASAWLADRERSSRSASFVIDHPGACWALALALYAFVCLAPPFPRAMTLEYTTAAHATEHVLYAAIAALVMLPAIFGEDAGGWPRRVLASRALTEIGVISYGIFLWHAPLLTAMRDHGVDRWLAGSRFLTLGVAIVPISLLCGWLSFRLVEQPALRLSRRSR